MQAVSTSSAGALVDPATRELQTAIQKCIVAISSAILYYDYFLTLPREVAWVWSAPRLCSWMNILFYTNRYFVMIGQPIIMFRSFWPSTDPSRLEICTMLALFRQYFAIAVQLVVALFMILRTYALYNFDRRVLIFFVTALLAVLGNAVSSVVTGGKTTYVAADLTHHGCTLPFTEGSAHRVGSAWIGLLAFDIITFLFTLRKSLREPEVGGSTIMRVLIRDGAVYFGIMTVLTVGTVASWFSSQAYTRGNMSPLTNVASSCLVTRLILNLRDPGLSCRFTPGTMRGTEDVLSTVQWEGLTRERITTRSIQPLSEMQDNPEDTRRSISKTENPC